MEQQNTPKRPYQKPAIIEVINLDHTPYLLSGSQKPIGKDYSGEGR